MFKVSALLATRTSFYKDLLRCLVGFDDMIFEASIVLRPLLRAFTDRVKKKELIETQVRFVFFSSTYLEAL